MIPDHYRPYAELGIMQWSTWEEGPIRDRAFPHRVMADYGGGVIEPVRFGAFLGWRENFRWWLDIAEGLPKGLLAALDLLEIEHQASGHSTIAWFCNAMPVQIAPALVAFAAELCRSRYHLVDHYLNPAAGAERRDYVASYRDSLASVGLTAQAALGADGGDLMEAVYPLDASAHNLGTLLAHPQAALDALRPILERPSARDALTMFILADNSD